MVIRSWRRVQVRSVCEDPCQVEVSCGGQACASVGDGFDCDCPSLPTTLDAVGMPCGPTSPTRKLVGGMEDLVIDWDLRCGSSSVHGRWAGRTPCSARVSSVRVDDGTCGSDGTFEVHEIPPGHNTLVVSDNQPGRFQTRSAAQQASRSFELAPGQRLDLGVLEPDAGCIQGEVECDQPLDEVYVEATSQQVRTQLDDEGAFMLCGLPPDEVIELHLDRVPRRRDPLLARAERPRWARERGASTRIGVISQRHRVVCRTSWAYAAWRGAPGRYEARVRPGTSDGSPRGCCAIAPRRPRTSRRGPAPTPGRHQRSWQPTSRRGRRRRRRGRRHELAMTFGPPPAITNDLPPTSCPPTSTGQARHRRPPPPGRLERRPAGEFTGKAIGHLPR